jgi:hypothetical protein
MIDLIRNDSLVLTFKRIDGNGDIITEEADKIFFTVKQNNITNTVVFQKTKQDMEFSDGIYRFTILPEDTVNLPYGTYKYDLEVVNGTDYKKTISIGDFNILDEVTFAVNEE